MAETRSRYWATIVYPESAAVGWLQHLQTMAVQAVLSPLHDRDVYEYSDDVKGFAKGDLKKPHYHLVFVFDSLKSKEQVKEITDVIKSVGQLKVLSISGTIRYLTHKDNKDKAQYDERDVLSIGGCDWRKYAVNDEEKEDDLNKQFFGISNFIVENDITEFCELVDALLGTEQYDLFKILRQNSYFWAQYLKSRTYTRNDKKMTKQIQKNDTRQ